jgi:glycosyltransferase involved in cell wall biosynthesis
LGPQADTKRGSAKRITVLSHFGWGMYRYRRDLLRALVHSGWYVFAIADWSDGSYEAEIRADGAHTESNTLTRSRFDVFGDLRTLVRLVRIYRRVRPDVAQHFHTRTMILGAIAARIAGVPRIVNCVTGVGIVIGGSMRAWRWLFLPLYRLAFGGRVIAVFQNSSDREQMVAAGVIGRERAFLIPGSGVDTEALKPDPSIAPEARDIVIMASRMVWSKGVREFVGAAEILKPRFPHIRFVLAGGLSGDYGMRSADDVDEAWVHDAVARGFVEWPGHVAPADVEDMFRRAAVVTLPSFYPEGVPRCLIEGAAAGAPIVTTDMPGCRDIVIDSVSGHLCPPHSAQALAEAIASILVTPGAVARMGAQSRRLAVEVFDARKISAAFERVYSGEASPAN